MTTMGLMRSFAVLAVLGVPVGGVGAATLTADDAVKVALEQVNASTANVGAARAAYLPRLDGVWQTNRATVNNVTGLLLPQSVIPSISGPPPASTSSASSTGTSTSH